VVEDRHPVLRPAGFAPEAFVDAALVGGDLRNWRGTSRLPFIVGNPSEASAAESGVAPAFPPERTRGSFFL
jgi:hypothetical protein